MGNPGGPQPKTEAPAPMTDVSFFLVDFISYNFFHFSCVIFLVVAAVVHHAALSVSCVVLLSCSCFVCAYVCLECFAFVCVVF